VIGTPAAGGSEYYGRLIAASEGLPIDFLDWSEDLSKIYSELDLLVVPSHLPEASTRTILEAYSADVPVVAFPVGGIAEIVRNDETGFLADAPTVDALARRILSVLRMNKAIVWGVAKRARKEWHDRFTLRTYRENLCDVLAEAMDQTHSAYDEMCSAAVLTNLRA
jgi:glycosyltransferase involved in cell wall biosynthesis